MIFGRNAVLEAARAGRVVKVYQAAGLGHDPRLDELAKLTQVEVVPPPRLNAMAPGVNQGVAAELKPRRDWTLRQLLDRKPSLLVALDPRGELLAWDFDFTQAVCVVVGSEGSGVQRLVKERCDARVRLPVAGHVASLNASAAAAALLYEVVRQRGIAKAGS